MSINNRIKFWRQRLGLSENEFASVTGYSSWMLEMWELQKVQPTLEALCRIRERLKPLYPGITLDDLLDCIDNEVDL